MSVKAKFVVQSYETRLERTSMSLTQTELRTVKLTAVADAPENKKFFRWTPNGVIEIGVLNPEAWEQFKLGHEFYVDFTPARQEAEYPAMESGRTIPETAFNLPDGTYTVGVDPAVGTSHTPRPLTPGSTSE